MTQPRHYLSRRTFLRRISIAGGFTVLGMLTACGSPAPAAPTAPAAVAPAAKPGETPAPAAKPAAPAAAAPAASGPAVKAEPGGTVTIVQGPGLRPMDASIEIPSTTNTVLNIFDPLIWKGDDLKLRPHLAKSW